MTATERGKEMDEMVEVGKYYDEESKTQDHTCSAPTGITMQSILSILLTRDNGDPKPRCCECYSTQAYNHVQTAPQEKVQNFREF